ncbi:MAG: CDP-alcohol phosphatidyltransferase family protein [Chloroflexi bacterium]|nr:CDP-alcohol phosphatidyltransferase family protein [Chloroflexota bacterium]
MGKRMAAPVVQAISVVKLSPNAVTVAGFVVTLAAAVLIGLGHFLAGGIVVIVAGFFDMLDGALARHQGKVTRFGAALDSTLDRYAEAVLFLGLLWFYFPRGSLLTTVLIYAVLVGSLLVSYVRSRAEGLGLKGESGIFTRPERVVVLALGLLVNQVIIALWVLAILTHVTVLQRLASIWKQTTPKQ